MSEIEELKRKLVEVLASRTDSIATKEDIYDFMVVHVNREKFNQIMQLLLDEFSIQEKKLAYELNGKDGFQLTEKGIKKYTLAQQVASQTRRYKPTDDSEYVTVITQDSPYGPSTTGVTLKSGSTKSKRKMRRQNIVILACVIVSIVAAIITLVIVL